MDILCTDKTGTLTLDRVGGQQGQLLGGRQGAGRGQCKDGWRASEGRCHCTATCTRGEGCAPPRPALQVMLTCWLDARGEESAAALRWAYLTAHFQTGLRSVLDAAILQSGAGARRASVLLRCGVHRSAAARRTAGCCTLHPQRLLQGRRRGWPPWRSATARWTKCRSTLCAAA